MHLSSLLSLALLSSALVPTSSTGGTSLILGASAQPAPLGGSLSRVGETRRRKRLATQDSHHVVMLARQKEKRQVAASSGVIAPSSAAPVAGTSRTAPAVTPAVNTIPTTIPLASSSSSRVLPSTTAIVPTGVTTTDSLAETDTETDVETRVGTTPVITASVTTTVSSSTRVSSSILTMTTTSTSSSAMSSATTAAEGSVSYVTDVQTIRASESASSTEKPEEDVTAMATVFETASASGNSTADAASSKANSEDSGGLSTGVIIGISVAGGVVVLAIALFVIWKLKQKRFNGYDDDVDGIKWPELNRHGESSTMNLPLPAKPTGGHGFETNALERSRMDLDDDGMDDYDSYSAPVSYANSASDHYGYGKEVYEHEVPALPNMGYMNDGYGMTTTAGGNGVTLGRNPSSGGYSISDDYHTPLGGTQAFETSEPEMLRGDEYPRGGDDSNLGRSRSGRLL